jgi:hypothetical protein
MKKIFVMVGVLVALAISSSALASAVLIDVQGKVKVTLPGKKSAPAVVGTELPDGSVVDVGKKAKASVMLESGAIDEIASGTKYKVGAKTKGTKRTDLGSGMALAMRELAASGEEGPVVHGMVRRQRGPGRIPTLGLGGNRVNARYPTGTAIRLGPSVKFRWSQRPPVDWPRPVLVIDDEAKRHIAIRSLKRGAVEHTVSSAKSGLAKGKNYSWYLATRKGELKGHTLRFEFRTLSSNDERNLDNKKARVMRLDMSNDGRQFLLAQLNFEYGLYNDAAEILEPMWKKQQAPFLRKFLYLCYARMGRGEEANRYRPPQP